MKEHLDHDGTSHISRHLQNPQDCHALCSADCFPVFDHTSTSFEPKIKEDIHIQREQPSLNQQIHRNIV